MHKTMWLLADYAALKNRNLSEADYQVGGLVLRQMYFIINCVTLYK